MEYFKQIQKFLKIISMYLYTCNLKTKKMKLWSIENMPSYHTYIEFGLTDNSQDVA